MVVGIIDVVAELKSLRVSLPKAQTLPDDTLLYSYENDLGFKFPDDYRYFLKEASDSIYNGKDALRVTLGRDSPRELITTAKSAWQNGVPSYWLPICEDNGNYYCLTKNRTIEYWSHDGGSPESWTDLAAWIQAVWIGE